MVRLITVVASLLAIGFLIFGINPQAKADVVIGVPCFTIYANGLPIGINCGGNIRYNDHRDHRHFERHDRRDDRHDHRR